MAGERGARQGRQTPQVSRGVGGGHCCNREGREDCFDTDTCLSLALWLLQLGTHCLLLGHRLLWAGLGERKWTLKIHSGTPPDFAIW